MFVVITSRSIPDHLHGYLSRFLTEVDTGVYVGTASAKVRDNLWERCSQAIREGSLTMINSDSSREQGYAVVSAGPHRRMIYDVDGLQLAGTLSPNSAQNRTVVD